MGRKIPFGSPSGQWQTRQQLRIAICSTAAIVEFVLVRGQYLKLALHTGLVLADFGQLHKALVIGVDINVKFEQRSASTVYTPDDGACFQFERRPAIIAIKRSAAEIYHGDINRLPPVRVPRWHRTRPG